MSETVGRNFADLERAVDSFTSSVKRSQAEVKAIDKALRLDQSGDNVELVKQKFALFGDQLAATQDKANLLRQQIEYCNTEIAKGGESTEYYQKQLAILEQQLKTTEIQAKGLTSAIDNQNKVIAKAQFSDMKKGMHDAQQAMSQMNTVMSSTTALMGLMGVAGDTSGNQTYQGMMKALQGMQAVIGLSSLLQSMNNKSALSFQGLAVSATMALGTFMLVDSLLKSLPSGLSKVVSAITIAIAALTALAVAAMIAHGTLTMGAAVPIILAAVAAGVAGIKGLIGSNTPSAKAADVSAGANSATATQTHLGTVQSASQQVVFIDYAKLGNTIVSSIKNTRAHAIDVIDEALFGSGMLANTLQGVNTQSGGEPGYGAEDAFLRWLLPKIDREGRRIKT